MSKHKTDHTQRKQAITAQVWRNAERQFRAKAALARRRGRQVLAEAYARAAERAAARAEGRAV